MSIPYFDAHCDTITVCPELRSNTGQVDLLRLSHYAPAAQIFAICAVDRFQEEFAFYLSKLLSQLERNGDLMTLCRSGVEIRQAALEGKIAAILAVEGAEHIGCSVEGLRNAWEQGVRSVNITWNYDNSLAGAAMDTGGGLTEQGRAFVRAAQSMGVIIDLSHVSERAFWEVLEIAERPVYASHSDAAALSPDCPRNLTDRQFSALAAQGGGTGINLYADFIGLSRDMDAVIGHIEHFWGLGGEKALFLGTDFDGIEAAPAGLAGVEDMERLYEALLHRNHAESLVKDLFYGNLLNILERAL